MNGFLLFLWVGIPFAIAAAWQFVGMWAGIPATLIGVIWWLGVCKEIMERAR